jgi:hypothetical protein
MNVWVVVSVVVGVLVLVTAAMAERAVFRLILAAPAGADQHPSISRAPSRIS